jgi:signal transduction histidine kinase/FixJ family two-component response regulator
MKTILLIDDDSEIRESVCLVLKNEGYNILLAQNGEEGIRSANENTPQIIICDFNLPDKNAYAIYKELNSLIEENSISFILMSGESSEKLFSFSEQYNKIYRINKPFSIIELLEKIESIFSAIPQKKMEPVTAQSMLDSLSEEIALLDGNGFILQVNAAWKKFARENNGYMPIGDFVSQNYLTICENSFKKNRDRFAKKVLDSLKKLYDRSDETFQLVYPCHTLTKKRWFLLRATRITSSDNIVISHSDITERILAEKNVNRLNRELKNKINKKTEKTKSMKLSLKKKIAEIEQRDIILEEKENEVYQAFLREKELNDLRTKFISTISHEIRTPLTNINLSAEILIKYSKTLDDASKEKYLHDIPKACKQVSQILSQFFLINKIDSNKKNLSISSIDLKNLVSGVISELKQFYIDAEHRVQVTGLEQIDSPLELDEFLLKQILINLLSNGLKYSEENSKVVLDLKVDVKTILIKVIDSGIGIKEEDRIRIFNAFFRGINIGNRSGTGLGLYIVKRSVDICKGIIQFSSHENEGTEFQVSLPIALKEVDK